MPLSRRQWLHTSVFGAGLLGLRAVASGLPIQFLKGASHAQAQSQPPAAGAKPDFLLLATSQAGDPVNANCPGAYVPGAENNPDPRLARTKFSLGSETVEAAKCWGTLPDDLRARLACFHHQTGSNAHAEFPKLMHGFGRVKGPNGNGLENLASMYATETAEALGTIQTEPAALGREFMTFQGRALDTISPSELKNLFAEPDDLGARLQALRDESLNRMYADLKATGTSAQKKFLDRHALGQSQAKRLGDELSSLLERLPLDEDKNSPDDQVLTAVALLRLNVAPVVTVNLPFGGDNHSDSDLAVEAEQTVRAMQTLAFAWKELKAAKLQDRTTVAGLNVFGRGLTRNASGGRNHNSKHHALYVFGKRVRPGVIGGVTRQGKGFAAAAINPNSGAPGGDVSPEETLPAAMKSLGAALGIPEPRLEERISGGKIVRRLLKS